MNIKFRLSFLFLLLMTFPAMGQSPVPEKSLAIKEKLDLANSLYVNYKYEEVIKELKAAIQMHKKNGGDDSAVSRAHLHYLRANAYWELGEYEIAIKDLDTTIYFIPYGPVENRPIFAEMYIDRGDMNMDFDRPESAIHDYTTSINFHHTIAEPYERRGYARMVINKLDQALSDYDQAIKLEPSQDSYYNRGIIRYHLKMYSEAISDMDMVIAENSEDSEALFIKAASLIQLNRRKEGCQLLRKASEMEHEDAKKALITDCE